MHRDLTDIVEIFNWHSRDLTDIVERFNWHSRDLKRGKKHTQNRYVDKLVKKCRLNELKNAFKKFVTVKS